MELILPKNWLHQEKIMVFQTMGDWCKWLERNFSPEQMIPTLPVIIRIDGNNFHNWTKGLDRPFDPGLNQLMIETTKALIAETNAVVGYTQSDEITLILYSDKRKISIYHEGRKQKILSKLTGFTVNFFNQKRKELLPNHDKVANFDCRIYQTPNLHDACVQLLWRENDATKNSIAMLASSHFSHQCLQGLNGNQMQDKLMQEKAINWNDLPSKYKRGTYLKNQTVKRPFTTDEIQNLPEKHQARLNPNLIIERKEIKVMNYPIFQKITNQVEVIFEDAIPEVGK